MVFGINLWPNVIGKPEMTELEIASAPNIDELVAKIETLNERLRSAEKQQQNLARTKQTAERHVHFFADEKKKAEKAADELRVALVETERKYQISQKEKLRADERCRRLMELLETTEQTATETRKENSILTSNIATLQTGIKNFTDDQVKHEMTMIYHELEQWIFSHIAGPPVTEPGAHPEYSTQRLIDLQASICGLIHQNFWSSFFVGLGPNYSQYMISLNNVVMENCPTHIAQHWRYGTSLAGCMLRKQELDSHCDFIVYQIGCVLFNTVVGRKWQMGQLKSLIWRCIELKHKLEYQEDSYIFWTSIPGLPFRPDAMCSFTQDPAPGEIVQCSLWPSVCKVIRPGNWEVVVKEIVQTIPAPSPQEHMADRMPGEMPNEEPDLL